jgi:hypothetical protein
LYTYFLPILERLNAQELSCFLEVLGINVFKDNPPKVIRTLYNIGSGIYAVYPKNVHIEANYGFAPLRLSDAIRTNGTDAGLMPASDITRAETAAIVQRMLKKAKLID